MARNRPSRPMHGSREKSSTPHCPPHDCPCMNQLADLLDSGHRMVTLDYELRQATVARSTGRLPTFLEHLWTPQHIGKFAQEKKNANAKLYIKL